MEIVAQFNQLFQVIERTFVNIGKQSNEQSSLKEEVLISHCQKI